ncbi:hypothetical protein AQ477_29720 [Burkholderia thailandensis]|nr:hypothetical protein AQ475_28400 [Burkholderia thailandensis]AOJ60586.1 hypothetical protein AQ477_29720 [Burkholderia thailandensis]AVR27193.1 hypothetical protein A8H32_18945 [Burkholderia thailandensis]KXF57575.1 hypothetical protein AQ476_22615 [Burkholderia thailandensis]PNE77688.1 hypothetical protein A8H37_05105 [Burkholderia thailandensis]
MTRRADARGAPHDRPTPPPRPQAAARRCESRPDFGQAGSFAASHLAIRASSLERRRARESPLR